MKHKRKLISLMLAFTLILAMPVQSFAHEDTVTTVSSSSEELSHSDVYIFNGPDGLTYVGYEISNNFSYDIYVGLTVQYRDRDYNNVGETSAYIPSVAPGEAAFIFAPDYYDTQDYYNYSTLFYGDSGYESATWGLSQIQTEQSGNQLTFSTHNNTYDVIYAPIITVVYWQDAMPVAAYSGTVSNSSGNDYIISKQDGSVTFTVPDIEYDQCLYYVTAYFFEGGIE